MHQPLAATDKRINMKFVIFPILKKAFIGVVTLDMVSIYQIVVVCFNCSYVITAPISMMKWYHFLDFFLMYSKTNKPNDDNERSRN